MTERLAAAIFCLSLLSAAKAAPAAQNPAPSQEAPPEQPAPPPPTLPRIVGQAQSQEELDAWNRIEATADLAAKQRLAEEFFQTYPKSGLTSYVHYSLAGAYRQANQNEKFIDEAEKALVELPRLPELTSHLAFLYAETGNAEQASRRAHETLQARSFMGRPESVTPSDWARARYRSSGDAHYALGRVELARSTSLTGEPAEEALRSAVTHLEQAVEQDPRNPYAWFRLGQAYTNQRRLETAIDAYAWTVALGGVIAPYARKNLEGVYEGVHGSQEGLEGTVTRQRRLLQERLQARQRELDDLDRNAASVAPREASEKPPPF